MQDFKDCQGISVYGIVGRAVMLAHFLQEKIIFLQTFFLQICLYTSHCITKLSLLCLHTPALETNKFKALVL